MQIIIDLNMNLLLFHYNNGIWFFSVTVFLFERGGWLENKCFNVTGNVFFIANKNFWKKYFQLLLIFFNVFKNFSKKKNENKNHFIAFIRMKNFQFHNSFFVHFEYIFIIIIIIQLIIINGNKTKKKDFTMHINHGPNFIFVKR